jgi:hypothetical protein
MLHSPFISSYVGLEFLQESRNIMMLRKKKIIIPPLNFKDIED